MNIYVGNLSRQASEQDLRTLFSEFGEITAINIPKDKITGQIRGFAFVEMAVQEEAANAIKSLNETEFMQRVITVNEARPKPASSDRSKSSYPRNRGFNSSY